MVQRETALQMSGLMKTGLRTHVLIYRYQVTQQSARYTEEPYNRETMVQSETALQMSGLMKTGLHAYVLIYRYQVTQQCAS